MFSLFRILVSLLLVISMMEGDGGAQKRLNGVWMTPDGSVRLEIKSPTLLLYNGEKYRCSIDDRAIYVYDSSGAFVPYFYRTDGTWLELLYPDQSVVMFVKENAVAGRTPSARVPGDSPSKGAGVRGNGGQNHLLRGKYCTYSSSGMSGSGSYSSTAWAYFDGQGRFQYGSGSYYSGGGDLYGNEGADGQGTYEVQGDVIVLRYPDGSSDRAYVYNRGSGGRITEVKYGSSLYAPQLCE